MRSRLVAWLVFFTLFAAWTAAASEGTVEKTIEAGGIEREYLIHVPPSYSKAKPVPLVFVFHGGGGSGKNGDRFTGFSPLADREGFIVVYPSAIHKNWNDGREAEAIESQRNKVDDIGFIAALLKQIESEYSIDPKRIYATGPSNGGIFSNMVGAKMSDRFAAIAPVIGGMAVSVANDFSPSEPVSVLMINGTEDPLVPFGGGQVHAFGQDRGAIIPTVETVKKWVAHDGCGPKPELHDVPDRDPDDETRARFAVYSGGKNNTEVIAYTIEGGGHTWSGGSQYLPKAVVGRVCHDFDATEVIWEFFKSHPKP